MDVTRRGDAWVTAHSGEISAWFIAQARTGRTSAALFRIESWVSRWLRWVVFPVASLSLLSALLQREVWPGVSDAGWIKRAWSWRTLLLATVAFVAFLTLPWQLTSWRPALPPTWVEAGGRGAAAGYRRHLDGHRMRVDRCAVRPRPDGRSSPECQFRD